MGGLFKKLNPFDRDDDEKKDEQKDEEEQSGEVVEATHAVSAGVQETPAADAEESVSAVVEEAQAAGESMPTDAEKPVATATASTEGIVTGTGLDRTYITKSGDKLEDIAAYFYGDSVQKQRLIDDNPFLSRYDGVQLPGGMQIHVSEDASRGDAVSTT